MTKEFPAPEKILPHKGKMVLLDRVLSHNTEAKEICTEVVVKQNSMFFDKEKQYMPAWVGLEYMAQSIAAYAYLGAAASGEKDAAPKIGFLLGARKYTCATPGFPPKQALQIKAKQLYYDNNLASFDCKIFDKDKLLAEARVNAYQPDSIEAFVKTL